MDIMLERILSLIPKKDDGSYIHGAKKKFAETIGLKSGNLIADWENGRSRSYTGYAYQIAEKYNVSVEWLQGQTDEKRPAGIADGSGEFASRYSKLSTDNRAVIDAMLDALLRSQSDE